MEYGKVNRIKIRAWRCMDKNLREGWRVGGGERIHERNPKWCRFVRVGNICIHHKKGNGGAE